MKLLRSVLLLAFLSFNSLSVRSQSVDEIVNKCLNAMGGKEKIEQMKTVYSEGEIEMFGNRGPTVTYILNGKGYKNEIDFNGSKIITVYTDKGGWTINPAMGTTVATAIPEEQLKTGQLQLDAAGPLYEYSSKGNRVELLGKDSLSGKPVFKLKVTTKEKIDLTFFVDANTYYIVKSVNKFSQNGQEIEMTITSSDFKKTDFGLVMPFTQELNFPGLTITATSTKIEINKEIDQAIFEMPKS